MKNFLKKGMCWLSHLMSMKSSKGDKESGRALGQDVQPSTHTTGEQWVARRPTSEGERRTLTANPSTGSVVSNMENYEQLTASAGDQA